MKTIIILMASAACALAGDYEIYRPGYSYRTDFYYSTDIFKLQAWQRARRERMEYEDQMERIEQQQRRILREIESLQHQ